VSRARALPAILTLGALLAILVAPILPARAGGATIAVDARDNVFAPEQLHVDPGDTVVWENVGFRVHTVTSDTGAFDSGNMSPGDTFSRTFQEEGFFFYHCRHHGSARNGMWGVVIVGDPPPPSGAREKIVVPRDYATIQRAVSRADPHSTIVVQPGTYRESVVVRVPDLVIRGVDRFRTVLDGGDARTTGISVDGLGDVTIRDITVRNYLGSGIALSGVDGYTIERVDLIKDRTFGLEVTASFGGVIEDVFVWGSGDSGIRIAECFACSTVVRSVNVRWSYLGLAAVNVTGVVVRGSRFVRNGVGIAAIGAADAANAPGAGVGIVANVVTANNTTTIPAAGLSETTGIPFGTGIWVAGSANAVASANEVTGHVRYGVLVSRSLDRQLDPRNATVVGNVIEGPRGLDLAWDGTGADNCFEDNDFDGPTGPPSIEETFACSARPFTGVVYPPVFQDVEGALALDPNRPQDEPPEPDRPRCQPGRRGCE
jgi:plastocyanin